MCAKSLEAGQSGAAAEEVERQPSLVMGALGDTELLSCWGGGCITWWPMTRWPNLK